MLVELWLLFRIQLGETPEVQVALAKWSLILTVVVNTVYWLTVGTAFAFILSIIF